MSFAIPWVPDGFLTIRCYCEGVEWVSRLMLPVQYSGKRERF
jgi:hypothetical protein